MDFIFQTVEDGPNCLERRSSMVAPQALHLMNNGMVAQLAAGFADRVRREAGDDPARQVERAWLVAYGRPPTAAEVAASRASLERLTREWAAGPQPLDDARARPLVDYCHALINSAQFLFID